MCGPRDDAPQVHDCGRNTWTAARRNETLQKTSRSPTGSLMERQRRERCVEEQHDEFIMMRERVADEGEGTFWTAKTADLTFLSEER